MWGGVLVFEKDNKKTFSILTGFCVISRTILKVLKIGLPTSSLLNRIEIILKPFCNGMCFCCTYKKKYFLVIISFTLVENEVVFYQCKCNYIKKIIWMAARFCSN